LKPEYIFIEGERVPLADVDDSVEVIMGTKENAEDTKKQLVLPEVPQDKLNWSLKVRPTVDGLTNILNYVPMLRQRHEDDWSWIMDIWARQMSKSSLIATDMAHMMTTKPNQKAVFCTFEDEALSVFSNEKWREALWDESPIAKSFVKGATNGAIGYLKLLNNSSARLVTHAGKFHHVESKSANGLWFDEGQNLDLDEWVKAKESQSFTNGKFRIAGIGGWVDTEYHKWWLSTDQRKFIFNDDLWREKLEFNQEGLVWGDYMLDVLGGHWKQTVQANQDRHGYITNQYQAPWIPLKKVDCEKYRLPNDKSIQWKQENYPQIDFIRHVEAGFGEGGIKPFPKNLFETAYDKTLSLLKPSEVDYELGDLYLGADWGGGKRTIKWIYQALNNEWPIFRLINAKKIETSNVHEQYQEVADWFDTYEIKQGVVDQGGGTHQVQELQREYGSRCLRYGTLIRPGTPHPRREEIIKFRRENRTMRDKTWMMEYTKDLLQRPHVEGANIFKRIIVPAKNREAVEWIADQFSNELTERAKLSGGGFYTRYYTDDGDKRPDDALLANNFAIEAWRMGKSKGKGIEFMNINGKSDPFGDGYRTEI
jgi:hypothetical protein